MKETNIKAGLIGLFTKESGKVDNNNLLNNCIESIKLKLYFLTDKTCISYCKGKYVSGALKSIVYFRIHSSCSSATIIQVPKLEKKTDFPTTGTISIAEK